MNNKLASISSVIVDAVEVFHQGGILAYPTEAVFGLGCDPDNKDAVEKLLALKRRPIEKGLILLAGNYSQLLPYIDDSAIGQDKHDSVLSRWPGPVTQVLPAKKSISPLLCGAFNSIAVRVTNHPDIVDFCNITGKPIVSTSANITGKPAAKSWQEVQAQFRHDDIFILAGKTLGMTSPSTIIDGLTTEVIRS